MAVLGRWFGDAGLRDVIAESRIVGSNAVDQVLRGKHYNRALPQDCHGEHVSNEVASISSLDGWQNLGNDLAEAMSALRSSVSASSMSSLAIHGSALQLLGLFEQYSPQLTSPTSFTPHTPKQMLTYTLASSVFSNRLSVRFHLTLPSSRLSTGTRKLLVASLASVGRQGRFSHGWWMHMSRDHQCMQENGRTGYISMDQASRHYRKSNCQRWASSRQVLLLLTRCATICCRHVRLVKVRLYSSPQIAYCPGRPHSFTSWNLRICQHSLQC